MCAQFKIYYIYTYHKMFTTWVQTTLFSKWNSIKENDNKIFDNFVEFTEIAKAIFFNFTSIPLNSIISELEAKNECLGQRWACCIDALKRCVFHVYVVLRYNFQEKTNKNHFFTFRVFDAESKTKVFNIFEKTNIFLKIFLGVNVGPRYYRFMKKPELKNLMLLPF